MEKYYDEYIRKLEEKIQEIEVGNPILSSKKVIELLMECIAEIKRFVLDRGFKNIEEEILFFKRLKPIIIAKLIYYEAIYEIETAKPLSRKLTKKYLKYKLERMEKFQKDNLDFYKYYRSNCTHRDEEYFLRDNRNIKLGSNDNYLETEHAFSTSHDYKVAKILAYDLIQKYVGEAL